MNLESGFTFIIFLIFFGLINYLIMLIRYENYLTQKKLSQKNKISRLYPKGSFLSL